jgi:hypothetical protein
MRWDRLTFTAFGGIAVFLIGVALLLEDGRVIGTTRLREPACRGARGG